jgi:hypothetical protein
MSLARIRSGGLLALLALVACSADPGSGLLSLTVTEDVAAPPPPASRLVLSGPGGISRAYEKPFPPAGGQPLLLQFPGLPAGGGKLSFTLQAFDALGCLVGRNAAPIEAIIKAGSKVEAAVIVTRVVSSCVDGGGFPTLDARLDTSQGEARIPGDAQPLDVSEVSLAPLDGASSQTLDGPGSEGGVGPDIDAPLGNVDATDLPLAPPPDEPDVGVQDSATAFAGLDAPTLDAPVASEVAVADAPPDLPADQALPGPDAPTDRPPAACGSAVGQPCCPGDVCSGAGTFCGGEGICLACGSLGLSCCPGAPCSGSTTCGENNTCVACGNENGICCPGSVCQSASNVCSEGACVPCGSQDQPCCAGNACSLGTVCGSGTTCAACGAQGQPCCAGDACGQDLVCGGAVTCVSACVPPGLVEHTGTEFGQASVTSASFFHLDATHFLALSTVSVPTGSESLCASWPLYLTILTVNPATGAVTAGTTKSFPGMTASIYTGPWVPAAVLPVDATRFLFVHGGCTGNSNINIGGNSQGFMEIMTVDFAADTISLSSTQMYETDWIISISGLQIEPSKYLVVREGSGDTAAAKVLTVNLAANPPITIVTTTTFGSKGSVMHRLAPLSGGRYLDVCGASGTGDVAARVITVATSPSISLNVGAEKILDVGLTLRTSFVQSLDAANVLVGYRYGSTSLGRLVIANIDAANVITLATSPTDFPGAPAMDNSTFFMGGPLTNGRFLASYAVSGVGSMFSLAATPSPAAITIGSSTTCPPTGGCPLVGTTIDATHVLGYRMASSTKLAASVVDVGCP